MLISPRVLPQFRDIAMHNNNLIVTSEGVEANRLPSSFFSIFCKQPLTTTLHRRPISFFQTLTHLQSRASLICSSI